MSKQHEPVKSSYAWLLSSKSVGIPPNGALEAQVPVSPATVTDTGTMRLLVTAVWLPEELPFLQDETKPAAAKSTA
ncbi:hypothetical protein [Amycolatopsis sp. NPDC004079]|uniref:hypothetical protein n=1 Tax=Amycolatopsis sp. NPDC004079 TaxID=3154549 RepID=UPI0033AA9240